ncbi:hypothetical protein QFC19_003780 [Naganishia cerealis]|uniref:Uncharacterized protein n=1 Tax=Naganishia cerealis TaxID=610337 RepID=A0ACC2W2E7_9TREE|nr:hypothetical protein QFC19_003780 [Naganishia cerealis]
MAQSASGSTVPQVTSSQILKEAFESKEQRWLRPQQTIQDLEDLRSFQITKRREYEQQINKNRLNYGQWLRYAKWEVEFNRDFTRARSIYERALEVDVEHIPFWTQYIRMELHHRNVNHARNLLERGVTVLPRVHKLWFMYVQTEEILGHYQAVRDIFERWLSWHPTPEAWDAYINFERRYDEYDNARSIFVRYVLEHDTVETWSKWIHMESGILDNVPHIRKIYELAANTLLEKLKTGTVKEDIMSIFIQWASWEASVREQERASAIYSVLLDESKFQFPQHQRETLLRGFADFEREYGNHDTIEKSIRLKRRAEYEQEIKTDPHNYDSWWALIDILKEENKTGDIKETYEKFMNTSPTTDDGKTVYWRRFVLLGIRYALWTEFDVEDVEEARSVWNRLLQAIPHKQFTFSKVWIGVAEFELRNSPEDGLLRARKVLGRSIGLTSSRAKPKLFRFYIELERKLGEWDRARKLFEKWIETESSNGVQNIWLVVKQYVAFEEANREHERCRSLFEFMLDLTTRENDVKLKGTVWNLYIEFEKDLFNYSLARDLYERYTKTSDVASSWISFALFESSIPTEEQLRIFEESEEEEVEFNITDQHKQNTSAIFKRALEHFAAKGLSEERLVVLRAWQGYENEHGDEQSVKQVQELLPEFVRKRRVVNGVEEEYIEYEFPGDKESAPAEPSINKFLQNAKLWAAKNG